MNPLWKPSPEIILASNLSKYQAWLKEKKGLVFHQYEEIWKWSTESYADFWASLFEYFEIIDHGHWTDVDNGQPMPYTRWFEGSRLNYAEHIFRKKTADRPAILHVTELSPDHKTMSWEDLERQVKSFQNYLVNAGVKKGDRVVGYLTNTPHATIAMLATISLGAIWSCCSPDFGVSSVIDRFQQIQPSVFIAINGYTYNGKRFDRTKEVIEIRSGLKNLQKTVIIPFVPEFQFSDVDPWDDWDEILDKKTNEPLTFHPVEFNDPIWILYSSGTTGKPKAITHSHGGMLLEHLKYLNFHNDVKPGERFFWFSTTGWMMWNFVHASLLAGATMVLYEGSPAYPDLNGLWAMASRLSIHHFGTSAPFIVACMKAGIEVNKLYDMSALRSIGSTGSPLPPDGFRYVYKHFSPDVWLTSMSGGTDVCTAFVGGNVTLPVHEGQIQCRTLGCSLFAFDGHGNVLPEGEVGEMVISKPMPCMPVYFWNDEKNEKYLHSYFDWLPGVWRHGDWIKVTPEKGIIILGRSDATLNRHGVRIGTAEIYASLQKLSEIKDALVVNLELEGGKHYMPLFVILKDGCVLDDSLIRKMAAQLKADYSPRHVPDEVFQVYDLPYTISGKKLETPVKKILMGMDMEEVSNKDAIKNPESLEYFKKFKFNKS